MVAGDDAGCAGASCGGAGCGSGRAAALGGWRRVVVAQVWSVSGRLAFLFTGQGSQRAGDGSGSVRGVPGVRRGLRCGVRAVGCRVGASAARGVGATGSALEQTAWAQAGLFALEVALFRLVESWGVTPDVLLGHSLGEIVAAHVSGILDLDDACTLVAERGRLMQALPAGGGMLAVQATEAEVAALAAGSRVIAAVNGPRSVVLSGAEAAIEAVRGSTSVGWAEGNVSDGLARVPLGADGADAGGVRGCASGLTFTRADPDRVEPDGRGGRAGVDAEPEYWLRQVRQAVRFADGVAAAGAWVSRGTWSSVRMACSPAWLRRP